MTTFKQLIINALDGRNVKIQIHRPGNVEHGYIYEGKIIKVLVEDDDTEGSYVSIRLKPRIGKSIWIDLKSTYGIEFL